MVLQSNAELGIHRVHSLSYRTFVGVNMFIATNNFIDIKMLIAMSSFVAVAIVIALNGSKQTKIADFCSYNRFYD